jgi:hypothetical protein
MLSRQTPTHGKGLNNMQIASRRLTAAATHGCVNIKNQPEQEFFSGTEPLECYIPFCKGATITSFKCSDSQLLYVIELYGTSSHFSIQHLHAGDVTFTITAQNMTLVAVQYEEWHRRRHHVIKAV